MNDGRKSGGDGPGKATSQGEIRDSGTETGTGSPIDHAERLARFAERCRSAPITSTAAAIVSLSDTLYNVDGSTADPKIDGLKWKQLLITMSAGSTGCKITQACYADTPAAPSSSSHDDFSVGGHMTTNSNGIVSTGGTCYLTPLCSWHNSTARDGEAFAHTNTCMLQLSGYMQAEPFETFIARLDGAAPAAIVYAGEDGLQSRVLDDPGPAGVKALGLARTGADGLPESFVILQRVEEEGETFYRLAHSRTAD